MGKKKPHYKSIINKNSKEHEELMLIKKTLVQAKEMLMQAKESMDKYAEENETKVSPLKDLIIFKKD